ncbi:MAG: uroporphyrinogen-III C-methyltransferase [Eubacterium sp.]|nr:uroporphyrinogen-III C-methyltransferase [Eubacterium sp.]
MEKSGKVYLVGAGPGDAELLTKKAERVLQEADVIFYDSLVGDAILARMPARCRKVPVGKRSGNHLVRQEDTNRMLLEEAQAGSCVVRLKGGDPFLFGRGGEELELLAAHGIPFEVVPGVTSAVAVPAYAGIPVTHRDFTSSVHIITGHRRAGEADPLNYPALVRAGGTLVFLMGVRALPEICAGLQAAGMAPETPAAVLERGTTAAQRRVTATLATLPEESSRAEIGMPAIIVVGEVCSCAEQFAWAENRPLAGEKILLMRPRHLIREFAERLRGKGAEVLEVPLIETRLICENPRLDTAVTDLETYQWIVFTSPTGVRLFFEKLAAGRTDLRRLAHCRFAVIGEGSRRELEQRGFFPELMPEVYTGEALGKELRDQIFTEILEAEGQEIEAQEAKSQEVEKQEAKSREVEDQEGREQKAQKQESEAQEIKGQKAPRKEMASKVKILIPRAKKGNPALPELLAEFSVDDIPLYETVSLSSEVIDLSEKFRQKEISIAVFTSASMVRAFAAEVSEIDFGAVRAACIGEQTAAAARSLGMQVFVSRKAAIESLEELIMQMHTAGAV